MKVLMVHNRYQLPGGEDASFESEVELLRARGHEVECLVVHNNEIDAQAKFKSAIETVWNSRRHSAVASAVRSFRPDVMHCQNIFPRISPAAYWAAKQEGVAVVQSLRNFRLMCGNALLFRDGHVCEDCVNSKLAWRGVIHGCYRDDRAASAVVAAMQGLHRLVGTWHHKVDRYILLTESARALFERAGLPAVKLAVKPNFLDPDPGEQGEKGSYVVFVGRLSQEKGVQTLLAAWRDLRHVPLTIVGDGPLRGAFERATDIDLRLAGWRSSGETLAIIRGARVLVLPSEWYETFGRVAVEAFACGVPVIASRLGAMAEVVEDGSSGLHFTPGDANDLAAKVRWAWENPDAMRQMGKEARRVYKAKYTAERNYEQLIDIYMAAIAAHQRESGKRCRM